MKGRVQGGGGLSGWINTFRYQYIEDIIIKLIKGSIENFH